MPRAAVTMMAGDILSSNSPWTDGDLVFANSTCFSKELMVTVDPAQSRNKGAARRRQRQPRGRKVELLRELRMRRSELGLARLHLS